MRAGVASEHVTKLDEDRPEASRATQPSTSPNAAHADSGDLLAADRRDTSRQTISQGAERPRRDRLGSASRDGHAGTLMLTGAEPRCNIQ